MKNPSCVLNRTALLVKPPVTETTNKAFSDCPWTLLPTSSQKSYFIPLTPASSCLELSLLLLHKVALSSARLPISLPRAEYVRKWQCCFLSLPHVSRNCHWFWWWAWREAAAPQSYKLVTTLKIVIIRFEILMSFAKRCSVSTMGVLWEESLPVCQ